MTDFCKCKHGTDGQTDGQTDRVQRNMRPPPTEEGRIINASTSGVTRIFVERKQRFYGLSEIQVQAVTLCILKMTSNTVEIITNYE